MDLLDVAVKTSLTMPRNLDKVKGYTRKQCLVAHRLLSGSSMRSKLIPEDYSLHVVSTIDVSGVMRDQC